MTRLLLIALTGLVLGGCNFTTIAGAGPHVGFFVMLGFAALAIAEDAGCLTLIALALIA